MRDTGLVVLVGMLATLGLWLIFTGWRQPRPSLAASVRRINRSPAPIDQLRAGDTSDLVVRLGELGARSSFVRRRVGSLSSLRIIGRPFAVHVGYLIVGAMAGLVLPSLILTLLSLAGVLSISVFIPAGLSLLATLLVPTIIHSGVVAEADEIRIDLRHQLSAYLDMMTMLLAGNTGHEGALQQAAEAGDGLLFRQLRKRMREVSTTGQSLVHALSLVAEDFEMPELEQVAAAAALSAAEGAPVAKTLAAKCSTLRSTLAADDEGKARVRNDKVTPPLVGMALLFLALLIYPALTI